MLSREDIIKTILELKYDKNEYWVTGGSALVMHGVKEQTKDIDLGFTEELYEELIKQKECIVNLLDGNVRQIKLQNSHIEFIDNWHTNEIKMIEGIPVASLESIKKKKLELAREKDFKDIEAIDEYLKKEKNNEYKIK
ncbi:MAG TPA: hypothetical protein DEP72_05995 [Clostridiales bacterium]|nr:MAG: hypothetical protein A2Y18_01410 [Clostridiales bacterium GWD2_32_19]HCC07690.1 hypothetical protein [Clostridiales bacterium]